LEELHLTVNARDLYQLKETLRQIPDLKEALKGYQNPKLMTWLKRWMNIKNYFIFRACDHPPPITLKMAASLNQDFTKN
jgi:DNA mismatch repair protein MutS